MQIRKQTHPQAHLHPAGLVVEGDGGQQPVRQHRGRAAEHGHVHAVRYVQTKGSVGKASKVIGQENRLHQGKVVGDHGVGQGQRAEEQFEEAQLAGGAREDQVELQDEHGQPQECGRQLRHVVETEPSTQLRPVHAQHGQTDRVVSGAEK